MNPLVDIFQPGKFSSSQNASQSASTSSGQSLSGNNSFSGLDAKNRNKVLESTIPKLVDSVNNYESNIDKSTGAAQEMFNSQSRNTIRNNLQGILNNLASKNMLNSSVASDSIGNSMSNLARTGAEKGFEAAMTGAALKAQLPQLLGNLINLGKYSEGQGFGSSTNQSQSNSSSFGQSSNPLEPYQLLAQYDWNMS
jgi:hypothetical protein